MSNNTKIEDFKTGDTVASHPSPSAPVVAEDAAMSYEDIKYRCTRFAHECRSKGIVTNMATVDLYDAMYPKHSPAERIEPSAKADDMERLKNKLADDFRKNYTLDLNAEGAAEEGFKAGWDKLLVLLQNQPSAKAIAEAAKNTCDIPGCKKIAPQNDIFCKDHRY